MVSEIKKSLNITIINLATIWLNLFQVKAVVLDPRNHFNVDRTLTKQDVKKLIEVNVNLFIIWHD